MVVVPVPSLAQWPSSGAIRPFIIQTVMTDLPRLARVQRESSRSGKFGTP